MKSVQGFVQFCVTTARMLLHDKRSRRWIMFWLTLLTMLAVFFGGLFWLEDLAQRPWVFLGYWGFCLLGVLLMVMLALLDLGYVTKARRKELRDLERGMGSYISGASEKEKDDDDDSKNGSQD